MSEKKTNAMRMLDRKKVPYVEHDYSGSGAVAGVDVVEAMSEDPRQAFKTLVTTGKSGIHYVFLVPVSGELDLKKAASSVGEKSIRMLKEKELFGLTGYVHGGCSPIGMKKFFKTTIDQSAKQFETVLFSGGRIGCQLEMKLCDLKQVIDFAMDDISVR